MQACNYDDPWSGPPHIYGHDVAEEEVEASSSSQTQEGTLSTKHFPAGWDEGRVGRVLDRYETQSDEEAVAEDEAAYESTTHTAIEVPVDLVAEVRELVAKHNAS